MSYTPTSWKYHTPWYVEKPYGESVVYIAQKQSSALVCKLNTPDQIDGTEGNIEEYAAFIVRVVNSHEELLEAAKYAVYHLDGENEGIQEKLKAAIAKAEGK